MSKVDRLLQRFLTKPKDFTFDELVTLLRKYGYELRKGGKTGGSRVSFIDKEKNVIKLHKPHGGKPLLEYQIKEIISSLKERGLI